MADRENEAPNRRRGTRNNRRKRGELRQYACGSCDRIWWSSVRSQVSSCRKCKGEFEPVPKDRMFGWAEFECKCGNKFSGFGQMGTTASECYTNRGGCGQMVYPARVKPTQRGEPKSASIHSCDARDCFHHKNSGAFADGAAHAQTGTHCVHPKSRGNKKKVLYASASHVTDAAQGGAR